MFNIDLKLLTVMNEIHRTRSVSLAGENLKISQAAISMSLAKLRKQFNDPLFVRTSVGMEPTPHAAELMRTLRKAEALLRKAVNDRVVFDPANSDRMFRLCATDVAQLRLLPALMERLKEIAPAVRIDFRNITPSTPKLLQSGEADLALGFIPFMGAGFYQQQLFKERFVCAARSGHPRVVSELTLQQFQNEVHIAVVISGTGHNIVEKLLEANKIHRNVGLRLPNFLGVAPILENTDFLVIVPEQLGLIFAQTGRIKLFSLPFKTPTYLIRQHWHERYAHDPANKWLRGVMASVYAELQQKHYGLRAQKSITATPR